MGRGLDPVRMMAPLSGFRQFIQRMATEPPRLRLPAPKTHRGYLTAVVREADKRNKSFVDWVV